MEIKQQIFFKSKIWKKCPTFYKNDLQNEKLFEKLSQKNQKNVFI